jgi:hypothetical protein
MTVSAAERPTDVGQSGSGGSWSTLSNLEYGNSGDVSGTMTYTYLDYEWKTVECSIPNFITDLDVGTQFVSLKMTWNEECDGTPRPDSKAWLTGGSVINSGTIPSTGPRVTTLDGDASYWGLSGTPQDIFEGLKDGSIAFNYEPDTGVAGSTTVTISDIKFTLTYLLADTKRAALIACLP